MEYAVEAANELLNLPVLPDSGRIVPIRHTDIVLQDVSFSYKVNSGKAGREGGLGRDSTEQNEVPVSYTHLDVYKRQISVWDAGMLPTKK